jgi:hypothetical protein
MRISANSEDSCYSPETVNKVKVFLDGVDRTKGCVLADDELGEIEIYIKDEAGNFVVDETNNRVMRETLKGKVKIIIKE